MSEIKKYFETHLRTCTRNATNISKTKQSELLSCTKDYIQSQIVADINLQIGDPYYGISVNKVTDCSNW